MSPRFLVTAFLFVASVGVGGCYDLGDPTGPRPEDFQAQKDAQQNAIDKEQSEHADNAQADCPDGTCTPLSVAAREEDVPDEEVDRKASEPAPSAFLK